MFPMYHNPSKKRKKKLLSQKLLQELKIHFLMHKRLNPHRHRRKLKFRKRRVVQLLPIKGTSLHLRQAEQSFPFLQECPLLKCSLSALVHLLLQWASQIFSQQHQLLPRQPLLAALSLKMQLFLKTLKLTTDSRLRREGQTSWMRILTSKSTLWWSEWRSRSLTFERRLETRRMAFTKKKTSIYLQRKRRSRTPTTWWFDLFIIIIFIN